MPKYVFVHKSGRMTQKTMSPSNATKFGEENKSVKTFGLKSKFVFPRKK